VPSTLGQLTNMEYLQLDSNVLTGTIPTSLGESINMKRLFLSHNSLTGIVPSSLCQVESLTRITVLPSNITCYEGCYLSPPMLDKLNNDFVDSLDNCTKLVDIVEFAPSIYTSYSKCDSDSHHKM